MAQRMYTVKLPGSVATLQEAAKSLGVELAALDSGFGLVPVSPTEHLYTVLVSEDATPVTDGKTTSGPYSNPPIGAFGPPRR